MPYVNPHLTAAVFCLLVINKLLKDLLAKRSLRYLPAAGIGQRKTPGSIIQTSVGLSATTTF